MDVFSSLGDGFVIAFTLQNLGLALIGCFLGTIIGALPGLGPSNGVAILIPLAFSLGLPPTPALILLTSVYYGAMYGGRISSILLNIPGDEPAMMTTLDGFPMAQKGQAGEALAISGIASFIGSFFATWGLVFLAPQLVKVALLFGPAEYFALFALAFATLGGMASRNQAKAALAAGLGLGIAMIGVDGQTGVPRFAFGEVHLYDGIDFLVAIVGLFALSEVFLFIEQRGTPEASDAAGKVKIGRITPPMAMLNRTWWSMARGTVVGFIAGVLAGGRRLARLVHGLCAGKEGQRQGRHLRQGRSARRRRTRSRQQRIGRRRAGADAGARRSRIGHHGGAACHAAGAQRHARTAAVSPTTPTWSGA